MGWYFFGLLIYFLVLLAESALVAVSPQEIEQLRNENGRTARRAVALAREIRPTMASLLLARLLLILMLVVYPAAQLLKAPIVRTNLYETSQQLGLPEFFTWFAAALAFATLVGIVFWGLQKIRIHKRVSGWAVNILKRLSYFITFWNLIFKPLVGTAQEPSSDLATNGADSPDNIRADQILTGLASEKREIELLKSIVKFGDVTVKQVMQPRSKVVAVDFKVGFHDLLSIVREAGFSRLPVYQEDLDNVTGILYVKDMLPHLTKSDDFEWQSLIRTNVMLAPESKRGTELLQDFKRQKIHMAIVVDEYGGSSGIVTLEDVLEEVTGEIRDEFDEESEVRYRKLDDHNYIFEGQTLLSDVCRIVGLDSSTFDEARGNADTLAGLVLELKGDIPKSGMEITWNGFMITVTAANSRRIEQLKLGLPRS
ncbi:MAG: CBS domain-containing protein [Lewinellaceae bacterium]|nr:CBS domain-containing protein [Lewinellaceae bacterium]